MGKLRAEGPVGIKPRTFIIDLVAEFFLSTSLSLCREDVERIFMLVDKYSKTNMKSYIRVLPGVRSILASLKENGAEIAVATTDLSERAKIGLRTADIDQYVKAVVGGDQVRSPKPSPDMLLKLIDNFNVLIDDSIMIGDASVDQEMASALDMDFIGVKTGLVDENITVNTRNSIWVDNMHEVKKILCG